MALLDKFNRFANQFSDLLGDIADDVRAARVTEISISAWCTRCHNERFYSHRCGDDGRQIGVIVRA